MSAIVKLDSFLLQHVVDKLDPHAQRLYDARGGSVMIVGELTAVERTEPIPTDPEDQRLGKLTLRLTTVEVASRAQEDHIRSVQQAMHRIRTSTGTIDELLAGQAEQEIELAGAVLLDGARSGAAE